MQNGSEGLVVPMAVGEAGRVDEVIAAPTANRSFRDALLCLNLVDYPNLTMELAPGLLSCEFQNTIHHREIYRNPFFIALLVPLG